MTIYTRIVQLHQSSCYSYLQDGDKLVHSIYANGELQVFSYVILYAYEINNKLAYYHRTIEHPVSTSTYKQVYNKSKGGRMSY